MTEGQHKTLYANYGGSRNKQTVEDAYNNTSFELTKIYKIGETEK